MKNGLAEAIRPVVAIVQARMSSTRLAAKVMRTILGRPILAHVVERLGRAETLDKIAVATSVDASDDAIEAWCSANRVPCHRGSLDDVLLRFHGAALELGARTVVRITADCPLIDPRTVDAAVRRFAEGGCDYVRTDTTFPDGLDTEVFGVEALRRANAEARLKSEREHVTPYIWKNPGSFKAASITNGQNLSQMRWTVDDERDLRFVTGIFEAFGPDATFGPREILAVLAAKPELLDINSGTERNEGYAKSLREDAAGAA